MFRIAIAACATGLVALLTPDHLDGVQERVSAGGSSLAAPSEIAELLDPFRGNPDSAEVAASLHRAGANSGFPDRTEDRVLVARLWRQAGEPELALGALDEIDTRRGSDILPLVDLERARVLLETDLDRALGARLWWDACESMDERVRGELDRDLLALKTPAERAEWRQLATGSRACAWLRSFWNERAHGMAIRPDERIAAHYRRLSRAREEMYLERPRFYEEVADHHGRPDSLPLDDRGLMFVRLGEPEAREICPTESDLTAECWAYYHPDGYRLYRFSTYKKALGQVSPSGDYSIQEGIPTRGPGDSWFHKYTLNADIPDNVKSALVRSGGGAARQAVRDTFEIQMDHAELSRYRRDLVLATRRYTSFALEQIPDAPDVESTVNLRYEILRFLNPAQARWQLWLLGSARAGDLTPSSDGGAGATLDVGGRFSILDSHGEVSIGELSPSRVTVASVLDEAGIPVRAVHTVAPGQLPLTVVVEDLNAPGTGNWVQDTINVPSMGGLPQLSDIAVAQAEGGSWTRDGDTYLRVSPAHITNPDGSIHTYFEVYGVDPDTRYEVELRLAPTEAAERIWRLEPDDLGFRLQFTSEMPGEIGRHHLRLDLGDTEHGEYVLAVRIQDEKTEAYSLPSVTDIYVAERN